MPRNGLNVDGWRAGAPEPLFLPEPTMKVVRAAPEPLFLPEPKMKVVRAAPTKAKRKPTGLHKRWPLGGRHGYGKRKGGWGKK